VNATSPQDLAEQVTQIFMPLAQERMKEAKDKKIDFVHYTTAENALSILRSRNVYMRNTVCMNDYREFGHGMDLLLSAFKGGSNTRTEFFAALNSCSDGVAEEAIKRFDDYLPHSQFNVYVTCLSEHCKSEDEHGRLSMWRAYNRPGAVGVAIVLNSETFWQTSDALKAYGSPVAYHSSDEFIAELNRITKNIRDHCDFLKQIPREILINSVFYMLIFAAACSKHPGFAEEKEWRLIHLPKITPSQVLIHEVEIIGGIPQPVYKIPLKDRPNEGLLNMEPAKLVKRVIIGPSNFPYPIVEALASEMTAAGIEDAKSKIVVSSIPLRTQT
jgi:hypothetical protein